MHPHLQYLQGKRDCENRATLTRYLAPPAPPLQHSITRILVMYIQQIYGFNRSIFVIVLEIINIYIYYHEMYYQIVNLSLILEFGGLSKSHEIIFQELI